MTGASPTMYTSVALTVAVGKRWRIIRGDISSTEAGGGRFQYSHPRLKGERDNFIVCCDTLVIMVLVGVYLVLIVPISPLKGFTGAAVLVCLKPALLAR